MVSLMRKRHRVVLFAALVAALIVPVGFALSLDSPIATQFVPANLVTPASLPFAMPDAAKLLGVGTLLFGLAAAVRKNS
jgi:hypothetical protein